MEDINEPSTSMEKASLKRHLSSDDEYYEPQAKHFQEDFYDSFNILQLSDEILLEILKNLDSPSLYTLGQTCTRFTRLVKEKKLWKTFDFSSQALSAQNLLKRFKYINSETKVFKIKGLLGRHPLNRWNNVTITYNILTMLNDICPDLEVLSMYEGFLNFNKINILNFPQKLISLKINKCQVLYPAEPQMFFHKIDTHLTRLQELSLEECNWFETHDLIIFSKLPELRILNLRGCTSLKECVPYGSIATRFGFKKLEILDVRNTPVSDSDIQCFNVTTTLKELLMECPEQLRNQNNSRLNNGNEEGEEENDLNDGNVPADNEPNEVINDGDQEQIQNEIEPPIAPVENNAIHNLPMQNDADNHNEEEAPVEDGDPVRENGDDQERNGDLPLIPQQPHRFIQIELQNQNAVMVENPENYRNPIIFNDRALGRVIIISGQQQRQRNQVRPLRMRMWQFFEEQIQNRGMGAAERRGMYYRELPISLISDRGICGFGLPRNNVQEGIIWFRAEMRNPDTFIERLVIRHYKLVTDISLRHLASCSPKLKYLDVTGTSVTQEGIDIFKIAKPECQVVSDFDDSPLIAIE